MTRAPGLIVNTIYPVFGYDTPLTTLPLLLSLDVLIIILFILAYIRSKESFYARILDINLSNRELSLLIIPALFPVQGLLGVNMVNTSGNNALLLALLYEIPLYALVIAVLHKRIPDRIFPPVVYLIGISILLLLGLRTKHVTGVDIHTEYYIFLDTISSGRWDLLLGTSLDAVLSIAVLPAVYQAYIGMEPEYLYKILFAVLFSITPLIIFSISRMHLSSIYALLATLFFMAQHRFVFTAFGSRTTIGILFFALSISVLLNDRLSMLQRRVLFIVFAISCCYSHYSTAYIFFAVVLFTWVFIAAINRMGAVYGKRRLKTRQTGIASSIKLLSKLPLGLAGLSIKNNITFYSIVIISIIMYYWFNRGSGAAFNSGVSVVYDSVRSLHEFFLLETRGWGVGLAMGSGVFNKETPYIIAFVFSWLSVLVIGIGLIVLLLRYLYIKGDDKCSISMVNDIIERRPEGMYVVMAFICVIIFGASVALPYALKNYSWDRLYFQMMVIISPLFVLGCMVLARVLGQVKRAYIVVFLLLVPYSMCYNGTMFQLFGVPRAIILNNEGEEYNQWYVHEQEVAAAKWLDRNADGRIWVLQLGERKLQSQGGVRSTVYAEHYIYDQRPIGEGYVYLGYANVVTGVILDKQRNWRDMTEYMEGISTKNLIFTSGGSEVWR